MTEIRSPKQKNNRVEPVWILEVEIYPPKAGLPDGCIKYFDSPRSP